MRVLNSTFTDFIQELHAGGFIENTLCTFVLSSADGRCDIVIPGIDTDNIRMSGDRNEIRLLSDDKDIRMQYDYLDMEDVTPDMSLGPEQIWEWRFCHDDGALAALLFEISA